MNTTKFQKLLIYFVGGKIVEGYPNYHYSHTVYSLPRRIKYWLHAIAPRICHDCRHITMRAVHYVGGGIRCRPCSEIFRLTRALEDASRELREYRAHIESDHEDGGSCTECCEHYERDHEICCDCGADLAGS